MAIILKPTCDQRLVKKPISNYDIQRLFETMIWAPSPFNSQPWEFIFIRGKKRIKEILKTAELPSNLLIVLNNTTRRDPGPNASKLGFMAIGTVLANLMATADYSQIGIYHIPKSNAENNRISSYLGIPKYMNICCLLAVGYLEDSGDHVREINPFSLIRQRKSYRKKFINKNISKEHSRMLSESALSSYLFKSPNKIKIVFLENRSKINQISKLIYDISYRQHMDQGYSVKMNTWLRYTTDEKIQRGDGVFLVFGHRILGKLLKTFVWILENVKILYPFKVLCMKKISKDLFSDLVASSPLVCAFLLQMAKDDDQPTDFDYINAGIAMQSMLLCATHLGIGAQFLSLLADSDEGVASVSKIFNFSKEDRIVDILRLGYIDKKSKSKIITVSSNIRRPVERIVHFENFNEEGDGPLS